MPGKTDIWKMALQDGYCMTLFRDEVLVYHKEISSLLDGIKGLVGFLCFGVILGYLCHCFPYCVFLDMVKG